MIQSLSNKKRKKKELGDETEKDAVKETRRNRNRSNLFKSLIKQQFHMVGEYRATARNTTIHNSCKLYWVLPVKINKTVMMSELHLLFYYNTNVNTSNCSWIDKLSKTTCRSAKSQWGYKGYQNSIPIEYWPKCVHSIEHHKVLQMFWIVYFFFDQIFLNVNLKTVVTLDHILSRQFFLFNTATLRSLAYFVK